MNPISIAVHGGAGPDSEFIQKRVRDEERTRIARELHDELGQMLCLLKMDVHKATTKTFDEYGESVALKLTDEIYAINKRIDDIIQSFHRISSDLRLTVLNDFELTEAIEGHAREMVDRTGLKFSFKANTTAFNLLDDGRSTHVFRIVQESLTNIIKHSNAKKVVILLDERGDLLILNVHDNGKCVMKSDLENAKSLGIIGMRERCYHLGGQLTFEVIKGKGTTVMLQIPKPVHEHLKKVI